MNRCRIHLTGASGSGVTTLGHALASEFAIPHHDTDDYYWLPTDPPFRHKRAIPDRLRLMHEMFLDRPAWVLSGALESWGIPVQHDLPGVGQNLHDHPAAAVTYEASPELVAEMDAFLAAGGLAREEGTTGLVSSSRCEGPYDIHIYPVAPHPHGGEPWRFAIASAVMAPRSRGSIGLNSECPTDPEAAPVIDTNYLSDPGDYDLEVLAESLELARQLGAQPALAAVLVRELSPGPQVQTRDEIKAWLLANATHDYHPTSTCRMGPAEDPLAVVDASGNLHGLDGLMIADASIMPFVTLANTNVPAFMVAEKVARDLLATLSR